VSHGQLYDAHYFQTYASLNKTFNFEYLRQYFAFRTPFHPVHGRPDRKICCVSDIPNGRCWTGGGVQKVSFCLDVFDG